MYDHCEMGGGGGEIRLQVSYGCVWRQIKMGPENSRGGHAGSPWVRVYAHWSSRVTRVIKGHEGHQGSRGSPGVMRVTRGHQRSPEVTRGHQRSMIRVMLGIGGTLMQVSK